MSAPNAGRQSPEPEKQSSAQVGNPSASDAKHDSNPSENKSAEESKDQLKNLPSNPKGALEDKAKEATSK
jgi:hypothetical protein